MSDVMLIIADARYPTFHFPPSLYRYLKDNLHIPLVLVLNKIDLVPDHVCEVIASFILLFFSILINVNCWQDWKVYFHKKYPDLFVSTVASRTTFSSCLNEDRSFIKTKLLFVDYFC